MTGKTEDLSATLANLRGDYRALVQRLEANEREFQRLGRAVFRVEEEERRRLARELHDGLGQNLTALKHRLALLASQLGDSRPDLQPDIDASLALCSQGLADTRELSRLLRPQVLDDLGLEAALDWLARTLGTSGGLAIEIRADGLPALEPDLQTLVFRLAQEALANVTRHAGASQAIVSVRVHAGMLRLTVWDDGPGFDVVAAMEKSRRGESTGLGGMKDRVALYGGHLHLESGDDGTRLAAAVPIPGESGILPP
ncbi:sensor histidine kinase [Arenimonas donghaensis]|uniref:Histidine kinase/HSP90-like ATPase domain-containing protein n=1 Tax=Arenimonas donghaensis DSM 18148 = HO3-R19 TaxID=1121014 RepID=A0A087MIK2_9GAMM|nr:histidine kinase [Arenimonas donghaensis]KFL36705.1 hypothetical protein N788_03595 [Arenimonas donghaensis DSM 18148 = HO3-R19]